MKATAIRAIPFLSLGGILSRYMIMMAPRLNARIMKMTIFV
jgi:hypothetical protein